MSASSTRCELLLAVAVAACNRTERPPPPTDLAPVSGPSWLAQLGLEVDETMLGRLGGDGNAPAGSASRVSGGDLYRFLCRSCHGPDARGQSPEVTSALAGVAAASPDSILQQMRDRGTPITAEMAASLARDARASFQRRLEHGGTRMPAYAYLAPEESRALLAYLEHLAGSRVEVPELRAPRLRIGELVVRGTCHICHAATSVDRPEQLGHAPVPTLASFAWRSRAGVIAKVRHGSAAGAGSAPSEIGSTADTVRARMPVMPYLGAGEVAAAFDYLEAAPPVAGRRE